MGTGVAIAALIVGAAGTAATVVEGRKGRKIQEEANDVSTAASNADASRQRRKKVRETRIRRARLEAATEASGAEGSSAAAGASSSLTSQLNEQLGVSRSNQRTTARLNDLNSKFGKSQSRRSAFGAVASLAFTGASLSGTSAAPKDELKITDEAGN
jgi:hypothetical protein